MDDLPPSTAVQIAQEILRQDLPSLFNLLICCKFWLQVAQLEEVWVNCQDLLPLRFATTDRHWAARSKTFAALGNWRRGRVVPLAIAIPKEYSARCKVVSAEPIPGTTLLLLRRKVVIRSSCGGVSGRLPSRFYDYEKEEFFDWEAPSLRSLRFGRVTGWPELPSELRACSPRSMSTFSFDLEQAHLDIDEDKAGDLRLGPRAQVSADRLEWVWLARQQIGWKYQLTYAYVDPKTRRAESRILMPTTPSLFAFHLAGQHLAVLHQFELGQTEVRVFDMDAVRAAGDLESCEPLWALPFPLSEGGKFVTLRLALPFLYAVADSAQGTTASRYDLGTGRLTPGWPVLVTKAAHNFLVTCSQHLLALAETSYYTEGRLYVYLSTGEQLAKVRTEGSTRHLELLDAGRVLVGSQYSLSIYTVRPAPAVLLSPQLSQDTVSPQDKVTPTSHIARPAPAVQLSQQTVSLQDIMHLPEFAQVPARLLASLVVPSPCFRNERFVILFPMPWEVPEPAKSDPKQATPKHLLAELMMRVRPGKGQLVLALPRLRLAAYRSYWDSEDSRFYLQPASIAERWPDWPWLLTREVKSPSRGWLPAPLDLAYAQELINNGFPPVDPTHLPDCPLPTIP